MAASPAAVLYELGATVTAHTTFTEVEADFTRLAAGLNIFRVVIAANVADAQTFSDWLLRKGMTRGLVTASARLSPRSLLYGSSGQCLRLYANVVSSIESARHVSGDGLAGLLERLIQSIEDERKVTGESFSEALAIRLQTLTDLNDGHNFRDAVVAYSCWTYGKWTSP